jgi:hypothetical protein
VITKTPTIATATAVSTIASGHQTAAIAVVPLDQNLGPYADIKETAPAGELRPLIRTPDGGGRRFQSGALAPDTAKRRRIQAA